MRQQRVTGADVALRAGVSRQTVSYVLNDTPNQQIPKTTRDRVLAAAEELSYAPNAAARALRRGRTDVVLVLVPAVPMSIALGGCIVAITSRLRELSYSPLVHFEEEGDHSSLLQCCDRVQPVGLASMEHEFLTDELVRRIRASGTQGIVTLAPEPNGLPTVLFDIADTGRVAMEHLASRGYRSVLGLAPADARLASIAVPRLGAARESARALGVEYTQVTVNAGPDAMDEVVENQLRSSYPRAILGYNDEYALQALSALQSHGVDVPGEVAVIGCDDTPAATFFRPPLTTTQIHEQELGRLLADSLHELVQGRTQTLEVTAPIPSVAVRDST